MLRFPEWKMMACDSLSNNLSVVVLQLETRQPAVSNGLEPKPKSKLALPWYFVQKSIIFVSPSLASTALCFFKQKEKMNFLRYKSVAKHFETWHSKYFRRCISYIEITHPFTRSNFHRFLYNNENNEWDEWTRRSLNEWTKFAITFGSQLWKL